MMPSCRHPITSKPPAAIPPPATGFSIAAAITANLRFLVSRPARRSLDRRLNPGVTLPSNYFGICIAGQADPAIDDYLVNELKALGIRAVRLDFSLPQTEPYESRLLDRLIAEGFEVCLHPVYPRINRADATAAGRRHQQALETLLDRVGSRIAMLEIGATVNRRKWRHSDLSMFIDEATAACRAARQRNIAMAAPNVTDFEPVYNVALLDTLRRNDALPRFHSNNLFVERAGEPEQFDHKIAGRRAAGLLQFDLIRKARILQAIGRWAGVPEALSAHTAWSLRRIARFAGNIESKQADYLSRYCALAAAGGNLHQVYWGPLIGQREGLIDDGTNDYPETLPHVTRYTRIPGTMRHYRRRPAWAAFQTVTAYLHDAVFAGSLSADPRLWILAFDRPDSRLHMVWTRDGCRVPASDLYPDAADARIVDRDGRQLSTPPATLSESPTFWSWPRDRAPQIVNATAGPRGIRFEGDAAVNDYHYIRTGDWQGVVRAEPDTPAPGQSQTDPATWSGPAETTDTLRQARNRVWRQACPWSPDRRVVIKELGVPKGVRRLLQRFKPSRARRSWNGAVELRRRGLPTPAPLAFFEHRDHPTIRPNYFICEHLDTPYSVRTFFTAYADGQSAPANIGTEAFFNNLAAFLVSMHDKGVFFRDLSAGNLLVDLSGHSPATPAISFSLIDTARARFFPTPLDQRRRLCDLMRICHPLHTRQRQAFLDVYLETAGISYRAWMAWPFNYYNAKHRLKKRIRRRPATP